MPMRTFIIISCLAGLLFIVSCKPKPKPEPVQEPVAEESLVVAPFDADTAYSFIAKQVSFGPRVPNTAPHQKCAAWLESTLRRFTGDVIVQSFQMKAYNGTQLNLKNIIGTYNAEASTRVLLCAHWDSRPYADHDPDASNHRKPIDGANDGGSGVGVLLEIARQLSLKAPSVGVDILLLDGEDYGAPEDEESAVEDDWARGSQYWSRTPHKEAYSARYGILLDMVGASGATFTMEGTSMYYAPDIMSKVWKIASRIGYSSYFLPDKTQAITDDHVYINQIRQIPTIDIIQHDPSSHSGFYRHWHTLKDDLSGIDKQTLKAVGQTMLTTVYLER